jgi:hypothetical protein
MDRTTCLDHKPTTDNRSRDRAAFCKRLCTSTVIIVALLPLLACGGSTRGKSYERALSEQEKCCKGLADGRARAECENSIVRVDDKAARDTDVNEQTFACIERHFQCDKATGRATVQASQKAYDCIADLEQ